jgi:phage terminase Nu1 subunit (DNA packaging protein)
LSPARKSLEKSRCCWFRGELKGETAVFPRLNQRQMAAFLGIKPSRLEWAGKEGIIERDERGRYPCEMVTAQWLTYERALHAKGGKRSEFERQRARLTRAKAEAAERKLAMLDRALVGTGDIVERTKAVCWSGQNLIA